MASTNGRGSPICPHSYRNTLSLLRIRVKSAAVGALATLIDFAAMGALVSVLGQSPRLASPIALALGIACQFVGNKVFAFQDKSSAWGRQAALFAAAELFAYLANVALFDVMVRWVPLPYLAVRAGCQVVVYFCISMPLWSKVFETNLPLARGANS